MPAHIDAKDFIAQSGIEVVVDWSCPYCGATNSDLPAETSVPLCGDCQKDVDWGDIVITVEKERGTNEDQPVQLRRP